LGNNRLEIFFFYSKKTS